MFSSTYAWVRSVKSIVASPLPVVQVARDLDLALLHALRHRGGVVRGGDAVAAHGDAVVGDVDRSGSNIAPLTPSSEITRPQYGSLP